jgi:hypothetical protein
MQKTSRNLNRVFLSRNSAEKCYMVQYIAFVSLDVSVIFVDLQDVDSGSEIQMGSDILFFFIIRLC